MAFDGSDIPFMIEPMRLINPAEIQQRADEARLRRQQQEQLALERQYQIEQLKAEAAER